MHNKHESWNGSWWHQQDELSSFYLYHDINDHHNMIDDHNNYNRWQGRGEWPEQ